MSNQTGIVDSEQEAVVLSEIEVLARNHIADLTVLATYNESPIEQKDFIVLPSGAVVFVEDRDQVLDTLRSQIQLHSYSDGYLDAYDMFSEQLTTIITTINNAIQILRQDIRTFRPNAFTDSVLTLSPLGISTLGGRLLVNNTYKSADNSLSTGNIDSELLYKSVLEINYIRTLNTRKIAKREIIKDIERMMIYPYTFSFLYIDDHYYVYSAGDLDDNDQPVERPIASSSTIRTILMSGGKPLISEDEEAMHTKYRAIIIQIANHMNNPDYMLHFKQVHQMFLANLSEKYYSDETTDMGRVSMIRTACEKISAMFETQYMIDLSNITLVYTPHNRLTV